MPSSSRTRVAMSPILRGRPTSIPASRASSPGRNLLSQPSSVDARWRGLEAATAGRFQVPTLRNVDKRPYPEFVKSYGHNGYFRSLKEIVHFYNARDVLPHCHVNDPGEGKTCWPAPEIDRQHEQDPASVILACRMLRRTRS